MNTQRANARLQRTIAAGIMELNVVGSARR